MMKEKKECGAVAVAVLPRLEPPVEPLSLPSSLSGGPPSPAVGLSSMKQTGLLTAFFNWSFPPPERSPLSVGPLVVWPSVPSAPRPPPFVMCS